MDEAEEADNEDEETVDDAACDSGNAEADGVRAMRVAFGEVRPEADADAAVGDEAAMRPPRLPAAADAVRCSCRPNCDCSSGDCSALDGDGGVAAADEEDDEAGAEGS